MTTSATTPRRQLEDRVRFLSAIHEALSNRDAVFRAIERAGDRSAAVGELSSQFGWDHLQAGVVLDLQIHAWTKAGQTSAAAELVTARKALEQSRAE